MTILIAAYIPLFLANIVVLVAFFRSEPIEIQNYRALGVIAYCALAVATKYVLS
jgi:hypothetical protein